MTTQGHHEATRPYQLGIDVGSTTVKAVVLDGNRRLFSDYRRHNADVRASLGALLADVERALPGARDDLLDEGDAHGAGGRQAAGSGDGRVDAGTG